MPKRSATSPDGGGSSRAKKARNGESSSGGGKRRKYRLPTPAEPLRLNIVKWRWTAVEGDEDTADDGDTPLNSSSSSSSSNGTIITLPPSPATVVPLALTTSNHCLYEAGPMSWARVLANYRSNTHAIHDIAFLMKDGKRLPAHSLILRIRVPFFAALLPGGHTVAEGILLVNTVAEVAVEWTDCQTLQTIIDIACLIKTPRDVGDGEPLFKLFSASMHMAWEELETGCFEEFQERLTTQNCLAWLEWAVLNKNLLVKHRASNFAAAHLEMLHEERDQELVRLSLEAHLALVRLT